MKTPNLVTVCLFFLLLLLAVSTSRTARGYSSKTVENVWTTKEPMPQGFCPKLGVANGKIYAFGYNVTYEYDPATDKWSTKKPMPTPRTQFGVAVYQNKIYVIGGQTSMWDATGVNEVYDPLTDTWETKKPMPTPRRGLDANVVNGKIYLIGGMRYELVGYFSRVSGRYEHTLSPVYLRINEVYDPINDTWTTKAPIPTAVYAYASAVIDNKIYVIDGEYPDVPARTQIYDVETNKWSYGKPIPIRVVDAAAGATTGLWAPKRIYVIGGRIDYGLIGTNLTQVYNPENDSWTFGASMPTARYSLAVAVVDDILYAIGGLEMFIIGNVYAVNEQYIPLGYGTILRTEPFPTTTFTIATTITALTAITGTTIILRLRKIKNTTENPEKATEGTNNAI